MTENEQLLEDYTKEIHGKYYHSDDNLTVSRLIESNRTLRQKNIKWNGAYQEARKEGYKNGYNFGVKDATENTILIEPNEYTLYHKEEDDDYWNFQRVKTDVLLIY